MENPTYKELEKRIRILEGNETRHKEAEQIAQVGYWELNIVNNKLIWSDEIYRIFGLKPQEFKPTYEAFLENIHPEDRKNVNGAYTNSIKNNTPYEIEYRLLLKTGEIKFVAEKCNTKYDRQGEPVSSIGTVLDITGQKTTEHKPDESDLKLRRILNSFVDGVYISSSGYKIEYMNSSMSKIVGEKAIGTFCYKSIHNLDN